MAGVIQADYLQPTSSAGLTILTPSGNTVASINTSGVFSTTGSLMLSANGTIITSTYATLTANTLQIGQSGSSSNNFTLYQPSTPDGTVRLGNGNAGSVTDLLTVTSAGNVGIGTSSPTVNLDVAGVVRSAQSNTSDAYFRAQNSFGSLYLLQKSDRAVIYTGTSQPLVFDIVGERMRIDSSGNVGIGTSSPSPSVLNVAGNATYTWNGGYASAISTGLVTIGSSGAGYCGSLVVNTPSHSDYYPSSFVVDGTYISASNKSVIRLHALGVKYSAWSADMAFYTSSGTGESEKMRLDSSGNLLVGISSAWEVNTQGIQASTSGASCLAVNRNTNDGIVVRFGRQNSVVGSVQVTTTTTSYVTSSDQRLKENIVAAPSALDSIKAIKVRSFDWKADSSHVDYGDIAQELLEVAPEAVSVPIDPEEMMGVDFGKITPRLVKAIQEMYEELQNVKSELAELKSRG